jgi:hypothetical protein
MRKDLIDKKLDYILPSIKEIFPGKPIKTEKGDGFVVAKTGQDRFEI